MSFDGHHTRDDDPDMSQTITTVNALRERLLGDAPPIAVSFADEITDADIEQARQDGLDVAELRIDRYSSFDPQHVTTQVQRFSAFPTIATIRTQAEGGEWVGSDEDRLGLFRAILPLVHGVDIELSSMAILPDLIAEAHRQEKVVIVSNHNFESTPTLGELEAMARRAKELGADFVKLSAMTRSTEDLQTLAGFLLRNSGLGLIVIGMGAHGTASRVFFPALGSRLTYAYAVKWPVSGQLTFDQTFDMLRTFSPEFNEKKISELQLLEGA